MLSTARQFNRTFHLLQALRGLSSSYILATNSDSLHDRGISSQGTTYAAYLWAQNISERKKKGNGMGGEGGAEDGPGNCPPECRISFTIKAN